MAPAATDGPRIDAVGLVAGDVAATVGFYRRLGTAFPEGSTDGLHVEGDLGGVRLMIDSHAMLVGLGLDDGSGAPSRDRPRHGISLAARCASPEAVDELYARLDADGFGVSPPWDAAWGQRYAVVTDPDGTQVDLYAALPT